MKSIARKLDYGTGSKSIEASYPNRIKNHYGGVSRRKRLLACGVCGWLVLLMLAPLQAARPSKALPGPAGTRTPFLSSGAIDDRAVMQLISTEGERLKSEGKITTLDKLLLQTNVSACSLHLPKPSLAKLSSEELVAKRRASALVVARHYKCNKCSRWHVSPASGFMLTADGAFASCYHILEKDGIKSEETGFLILTGDGRVAPVTDLLAANPAADTVILKADGQNFVTAPLATNVAAGAIVRVISNPDQRFFSLSEGVVSRLFVASERSTRRNYTALAITADFARGSSGGPVFNEQGSVVGMVDNTQSIYYGTNSAGIQDNLQMVFKNCVFAGHIVDMIRPR